MGELEKYYQSLLQEVQIMQLAEEEGLSQEDAFTSIAMGMLSEVGTTQNTNLSFYERALGTAKQTKISGYAISDNETLDLFISIYVPNEEIGTVTESKEIANSVKRINNFFQDSVNHELDEIEESGAVYDLVYSLSNDIELRNNLIRVNIFILTNCAYNGSIPDAINYKIGENNIKMFYNIVDINYLYKISRNARASIDVDLVQEGYDVQCLAAKSENKDYKSYLAIFPGNCISDLYERYGSRLMEQNVRSFLQFNGKVNKGIRNTIKNEPHMFFAFNNGLAATADDIELDEENNTIKSISNLQIVNGGQTTAAIYNTYKGDKADVSSINVQVKISVIKEKDRYNDIVSLISKYSNSQNKVNDADFSSNNPSLVELERLSDYVFTPVTEQTTTKTCWFFERTRGQYKTRRNREGTNARKKNFDIKYPKNQLFNKYDLGKYINCYEEYIEDGEIKVSPADVVKGNDINFTAFVNYNLPKKEDINNVYFEDVVAKAILFKATDKLYGTRDNKLGDFKQVVVPFTIGLLTLFTKGKLNLYKIWLNQSISDELSAFIFNLMKQVNKYLPKRFEGNTIQKCKKVEAWIDVKNQDWKYNLDSIFDDLVDGKNQVKRKVDLNISDEEKEQNKKVVEEIPSALWAEIVEWGKDSKLIDLAKRNVASDLAYSLREKRPITENQYRIGTEIINIVAKENPSLLEEKEALAGKKVALKKVSFDDEEKFEMFKNVIRRMLDFDREAEVLNQNETDKLYDILNEKVECDQKAMSLILQCSKKLQPKGFKIS